jgi:hypothetical protein
MDYTGKPGRLPWQNGCLVMHFTDLFPAVIPTLFTLGLTHLPGA